ncbi:hypothetical protein [Delftia acidovorans]
MPSHTRLGGFFISCSPMKKIDKPYTPSSNCYQGKELKPHPGLPASRTYAFKLPSRMGDWLHYPGPNRRVEPFPTPNKAAA